MPCGHIVAYELARQVKRSRAHTSGEQSEQLVDARVVHIFLGNDSSSKRERTFIGHMAELVDALVSGTSGATLGSSSLLMPTIRLCQDKAETVVLGL